MIVAATAKGRNVKVADTLQLGDPGTEEADSPAAAEHIDGGRRMEADQGRNGEYKATGVGARKPGKKSGRGLELMRN
jgi:hypothetical protein